MSLLPRKIVERSTLGLFACALQAFYVSTAQAQAEHPLMRGAIYDCRARGWSHARCQYEKQQRIARIKGTIQACEEGIMRSCNALLQFRELSDEARSYVAQVRAGVVARGEDNPATQILRRNTTEAPPGAYRAPEITVRSGIPLGVSAGTGGAHAGTGGAHAGTGGAYADTGGAHSGTGGAAPGVPFGVSPGIPDNVHTGVSDNVRSGTGSATAGLPENVTTGTPAHSSTPAMAAVPNGVSPGVPAGVSSGTTARSGVPDNITTGSAQSGTPAKAAAESARSGAATSTSGSWKSIAPTETSTKAELKNKFSTSSSSNAWKSIAPSGTTIASLDARSTNQTETESASKLTLRERELIALRRDAAAAESDYYTAMEDLHSDYAWWLGKTEQVGSLASVMRTGLVSKGSIGLFSKGLAQDFAMDQSIKRGVPYIMEHVPAADAANTKLWFGGCPDC